MNTATTENIRVGQTILAPLMLPPLKGAVLHNELVKEQ
jgi:hypothetical protein